MTYDERTIENSGSGRSNSKSFFDRCQRHVEVSTGLDGYLLPFVFKLEGEESNSWLDSVVDRQWKNDRGRPRECYPSCYSSISNQSINQSTSLDLISMESLCIRLDYDLLEHDVSPTLNFHGEKVAGLLWVTLAHVQASRQHKSFVL